MHAGSIQSFHNVAGFQRLVAATQAQRLTLHVSVHAYSLDLAWKSAGLLC